jgi:oxygen-independent coproporphyrinogen-3 oxidase
MERLGAWERTVDRVDARASFEESLFLGLRMNEGIDLRRLGPMVGEIAEPLDELEEAGLVVRDGARLRLTAVGRMVSNEVFERLLVSEAKATAA